MPATGRFASLAKRTLVPLGMVTLAATGTAAARVDEAQAGRLGGELTPIGAERAGNVEGTIPEWRGGLTEPPPCFGGPAARYCDPFADDRPLFVITAANVERYADRLSAGQVELLRQHPDSYRMPVYGTRRSFANPEFVYAATRQNATRAELRADGEALEGAVTGIPFPIPQNGREVVWNHRTRYREAGLRRWNNQFAVTPSGDFSRTTTREDVLFAYSQPGITADALDNVLQYVLQVTTRPERLAGSVLLLHETLDASLEAPRAWQYNPGQRRLRRTPNVGYDSPAAGADGLRTNDQRDGFSGAMDRYSWKLLGRREMFVPANSYRLHSDAVTYLDLVGKAHVNPDQARYELRRVWVVEANLRPSMAHEYARRVFYIDEDGWQIRVVDVYDRAGMLWRLQEMHSVIAYDRLYELPVCETVYDLPAKRYLVQALNNEEPETAVTQFDEDHFEPGSVSRFAKK